MTIKTRRPTGKPSWPIVLLAGKEGAGKSWSAALASASPMIGRTLWVGIGEDDPDEYGVIPGADFEIVEHDGSYRSLLQAVRDAAAEPQGDLPTLLVVDSMTRLWNQITDNAQAVANQRRRGQKKAGSDDYTISADLWNVAAGQWSAVMDAIRSHAGPAILTARLDEVMVMDADGRPTKDRAWKVQGHKSLPFDVGVLVQMHERGHFLITKRKSARDPLEAPVLAPGFTVPLLWERLGITSSADTGVRSHQGVVTDEAVPADAQQQAGVPAPKLSGVDWESLASQATSRDELNQLWARIGQEDPAARTTRLHDRLKEVAASFVAQAPSPGPERPWAKEDEPAAPAGEAPAAAADGSAEPLPGMDAPAEDEPYGGGDRG